MAILRDDQVLANLTFDQKIHQKYGGVVPEWASRQHFEAMLPLYREVCQQAGISAQELNAIAVTQGPGLMGSLVVGLGFAKGLCLGLGIPLLRVNHLEAHVMSLMIDEPRPVFPFLCLTVSGGHTMLAPCARVNALAAARSSRRDGDGIDVARSACCRAMQFQPVCQALFVGQPRHDQRRHIHF